jgi:hypothetical protein
MGDDNDGRNLFMRSISDPFTLNDDDEEVFCHVFPEHVSPTKETETDDVYQRLAMSGRLYSDQSKGSDDGYNGGWGGGGRQRGIIRQLSSSASDGGRDRKMRRSSSQSLKDVLESFSSSSSIFKQNSLEPIQEIKSSLCRQKSDAEKVYDSVRESVWSKPKLRLAASKSSERHIVGNGTILPVFPTIGNETILPIPSLEKCNNSWESNAGEDGDSMNMDMNVPEISRLLSGLSVEEPRLSIVKSSLMSVEEPRLSTLSSLMSVDEPRLSTLSSLMSVDEPRLSTVKSTLTSVTDEDDDVVRNSSAPVLLRIESRDILLDGKNDRPFTIRCVKEYCKCKLLELQKNGVLGKGKCKCDGVKRKCTGTLISIGTKSEVNAMRGKTGKKATEPTKYKVIEEFVELFKKQRAKDLKDAQLRQKRCTQIGVEYKDGSYLSCNTCGDPRRGCNDNWQILCGDCMIAYVPLLFFLSPRIHFLLSLSHTYIHIHTHNFHPQLIFKQVHKER